MKKPDVSRRNFLKASGFAAAAVTLPGMFAGKTYAATQAWTTGMKINDAIDNLRVVCCYDPAMVTGTYPADKTFAGQNAAVDGAKIEANLDNMAILLTQKATAAQAWATIFRKPVAKTWAQVRCALKTNCFFIGNMPRLAVVAKVAKELINLGVTASNIIIYDGQVSAGQATKYGQYVNNGLPSGVKVSSYNTGMGGTALVNVPAFTDVTCSADIANGNIDILVNLAVNKGHVAQTGGVTLSMKNHFGTFYPHCHLTTDHPEFDITTRYAYIVAINKTDAIVGGTPPRQQLVILDSLWGCKSGPTADVTHMPAELVMGTFGPAVDYLTIMKIRKTVMGITPNALAANFLTDFGYTAAQRDALDFFYVSGTPTNIGAGSNNVIFSSRGDDTQKIKGTFSIAGQRIQGNNKTGRSFVIENGKKILKAF